MANHSADLERSDRRRFLGSAISAAGLSLAACTPAETTRGVQTAPPTRDSAEAEVTPGEDLMQEHGVRAQRQTDLVTVLLRQHQRGREVTDDVQRRVSGPASAELAQLLRAFSRMYRPHMAREDTLLFPAFRGVVGRAGYRELGEQFEDKEHQLFGEHGFKNTVSEIAGLETALGIAELARFTVP